MTASEMTAKQQKKTAICNETSGHFPALFGATESDILRQNIIFSESEPSGFCA